MNIRWILNKKILFSLAIVTIIILVLSLVSNPPDDAPRVLSSSPIPNATNVRHSDNIVLKFDQDLDTALLEANSIPEEVWDISSTYPAEIILTSNQFLRVDTQYILNLTYDGKPIYSLNFKTIPQQSDPRYAQEVVQELAKNYPLASKIPFENSLFRIVYTSPLTIEITIKNPNLTSLEVIEEVKSWVTQNGGNASSHKYIVAD